MSPAGAPDLVGEDCDDLDVFAENHPAQVAATRAEQAYFAGDLAAAVAHERSVFGHWDQWYSSNIVTEHLAAMTFAAVRAGTQDEAEAFLAGYLAGVEAEVGQGPDLDERGAAGPAAPPAAGGRDPADRAVRRGGPDVRPEAVLRSGRPAHRGRHPGPDGGPEQAGRALFRFTATGSWRVEHTQVRPMVLLAQQDLQPLLTDDLLAVAAATAVPRLAD